MALFARLRQLWSRLQCSRHPLSAFPTIVFLLTCGQLVFHILMLHSSRRLRRQIITRQLIFQTLFSWLLMQTLRLWFLLNKGLQYLIKIYWLKMAVRFPTKEVAGNLSPPEPDLSFLPFFLEFFLVPSTLNMIISTLLACVPLWICQMLPEIEEPNLMVWLNMHRFTRISEIGSSGYFLSRPLPDRRHSVSSVMATSVSENSTPQKRKRARSLPSRATSSRILKRRSFPANFLDYQENLIN